MTMTREEAILKIEYIRDGNDFTPTDAQVKALDMAIKALSDHSGEVTEMVKKDLTSAVALLKQEIDFHKEVSRIEAEKVVGLEHKLADMVSVVRCKNCKWWQDNIGCYSVSYCPWDTDIGIPDADDFCSCGERIEK